MIKLIKNFIKSRKYTLIDKSKCTFTYVLKAYLLIFIFIVVSQLIFFFLDIEYNLKSAIEYNNKHSHSKSNLLFKTLIFAPIIEEIIFRLHLKPKNQYFTISILVLFLAIVKSYLENSLLFYILLIYVTLLVTIWILIEKFKTANSLFKISFIFSVLFFGLSHISYIKLFDLHYWPIYLMYFVPMFIIGYYLSIIRIKLNMFHSIFAHFIFNLLPFLFTLNKI